MSTLNPTLPSGSSTPSPCSTRLAEITPVPKAEAGRVLSSTNVLVATGLTLLPIATGLVGGFGGLGLAAYVADGNPPLAAALAVGGVLSAVLSLVTLLRYQQLLPSRYVRCQARRAFAHRLHPLVRFEDADAQFLDVVPRSNWGRTMMEPATDTGLLRIDAASRELLFEGDSKRYRIPFDSVTSCEVEEIRLDSDQWGNDLYFATVVSVETSMGAREIPLACRHLAFQMRRMPQRRAEAEELCDRIQQALAG